MNQQEKEAREKLKDLGFQVDKNGGRYNPDVGTVKDGLLRRMAGLPPKRAS